VFAQGLIEKGALDGLAMEVSTLKGMIWASVEDGRIVYVILIVALIVLFRVSSRKP
jgi:hypothetical protein